MVQVAYPWQSQQWEILAQARRQRRLPHAVLFSGPPGVGKKDFAMLLAQLLLCEANGERDLPCGTCRGCRLCLIGGHPDFRIVERPEDKSAISVDQVRELATALTLKGQYAAHKVVIIAAADEMNINASNAILKTLEEPPSDSVLILISAREHALPATIRSRCQRYFFPTPPLSLSLPWLVSQEMTEREAVERLELAAGAPLEARAIEVKQVVAIRADLASQLNDLQAGRADPVDLAANWLKFGAKQSLYWLYDWTAERVRQQAFRSARRSSPREVAAEGRSGETLPPYLFDCLDRINEALRLLDTQVNTTLLLEQVALDIRDAVRLQSGPVKDKA